MRKRKRTPRSETQNPLFTVLGTSRRRAILRILRDRTTVISEHKLSLTLAAIEQELSVADVPNEEARDIRLDLRHSHLPLLEDSGLVNWKREEGTVATTDHVALTDPLFHRLLAVESTELDEVLSVLSNKRRRLLLAILRDDPTPLSRTALLQELARQETGETAPNQAVLDDIMVSLSHDHLPRLATAGIIDYDAETDHVAYIEHPELEELFTLLHKPDNRLVSKLDGFFGGLLTSYRQANKSSGDPIEWPNFWSESHHG